MRELSLRPALASAHLRPIMSTISREQASDFAFAPPTSYASDIGVPQPIARRLLERFALIAFALYHIPLFVNNYPSLGGGGFNDTGLAPRWGRIFTIPSIWVAKTVFHVAKPGGATGDNGDTSEEFARLFICVVVGVIGAVVWTLADRRRPRGEWVESTNRVLLRYSIALGLMSYAVAKIFPQQFPPIAIGTLDRRVGDLPPMSLLWTFMQYSRPYAFFGGLMELTACILLCFRRTATLGALVCLAVMTNVTLMNYLYAVPVKLYATMITLSAAVLVLYDARRLFDVFVRNRSVAPSSESTIIQDSVPALWRRIIKIGAVGSVALSSVVAMAGTMNPATTSSPIEGAWNVSPSTSSAAWRSLNISRAAVVVRTASDSVFGCRIGTAAEANSLLLQCPRGHTGAFQWSRSQDTLHLHGTFDDAPIDLSATIKDRSSYLLMRSKFRWIFD
jgi:hypothetical protein